MADATVSKIPTPRDLLKLPEDGSGAFDTIDTAGLAPRSSSVASNGSNGSDRPSRIPRLAKKASCDSVGESPRPGSTPRSGRSFDDANHPPTKLRSPRLSIDWSAYPLCDKPESKDEVSQEKEAEGSNTVKARSATFSTMAHSKKSPSRSPRARSVSPKSGHHGMLFSIRRITAESAALYKLHKELDDLKRLKMDCEHDHWGSEVDRIKERERLEAQLAGVDLRYRKALRKWQIDRTAMTQTIAQLRKSLTKQRDEFEYAQLDLIAEIERYESKEQEMHSVLNSEIEQNHILHKERDDFKAKYEEVSNILQQTREQSSSRSPPFQNPGLTPVSPFSPCTLANAFLGVEESTISDSPLHSGDTFTTTCTGTTTADCGSMVSLDTPTFDTMGNSSNGYLAAPLEERDESGPKGAASRQGGKKKNSIPMSENTDPASMKTKKKGGSIFLCGGLADCAPFKKGKDSGTMYEC